MIRPHTDAYLSYHAKKAFLIPTDPYSGSYHKMGVSCITGFLQNVFGARVCLQEQAAIGINGLEFLMPSTAVTQGLQGRARPMKKWSFGNLGFL